MYYLWATLNPLFYFILFFFTLSYHLYKIFYVTRSYLLSKHWFRENVEINVKIDEHLHVKELNGATFILTKEDLTINSERKMETTFILLSKRTTSSHILYFRMTNFGEFTFILPETYLSKRCVLALLKFLIKWQSIFILICNAFTFKF